MERQNTENNMQSDALSTANKSDRKSCAYVNCKFVIIINVCLILSYQLSKQKNGFFCVLFSAQTTLTFKCFSFCYMGTQTMNVCVVFLFSLIAFYAQRDYLSKEQLE